MRRALAVVVLLAPLAVHAGTAVSPAMLGGWKGRAEFVAVDPEDETPVPIAHSVEQLSLRIDASLAVSGGSPRNGCAVLGKAAPQGNAATDTSIRLDVMVSGCREAEMNRRYGGTLATNRAMQTTELRLMVEDERRVRYEIKGNLERQP